MAFDVASKPSQILLKFLCTPIDSTHNLDCEWLAIAFMSFPKNHINSVRLSSAILDFQLLTQFLFI